MGVVIDSCLGLDAEAVHDDLGAAPLQEGFLDVLAAGVFADLAQIVHTARHLPSTLR